MTAGSVLSQGAETAVLRQRSLHSGWDEDSVGVVDYKGRWQRWGKQALASE